MTELLQYGGALLLVLLLAVPSGNYLYKVFCGQEVFLSDFLVEREERIYRLLQVNPRVAMNWGQYVKALVTFHGIGFLLLYLWIVLTLHLPHVPETVTANSWRLALVTVVSFLFHLPQPVALDALTQGVGLVLQNLTAASLIAVCFAVIRTFFSDGRRSTNHYWVDLVRIILYLFLPLAVLCACVLFAASMIRLAAPAVWLIQVEGSSAFVIFRGIAGLFSLFWLPAALCVAFGRYVQQRASGAFVCLLAALLQLAALACVQQIPQYYGLSMLYSLYQQQSISAGFLLLLSQLSKISFGGTGGLFHLLLFVLLSILFTGCCKRCYQRLTFCWEKNRKNLHSFIK